MAYVSSGHGLGQLIGDWFEEYVVSPLLLRVANDLNLFLDTRFTSRSVRGEKIIWDDIDGNSVDYDFVMELNGANNKIGIPVAFIESFWRRGSRHSKDKARDDSGKLRPMRDTYPTARFLGIVAAGALTAPARELIINQQIDLFYFPKAKIVKAFQLNGLVMDYPDRSAEDEKQIIVSKFADEFTVENKKRVADTLAQVIGISTLEGYTLNIRSKLSALPQEIRINLRKDYAPYIFETVNDVSRFLEDPSFSLADPSDSYFYQIIYSDGSNFEKPVPSISELQELHRQLRSLSDHVQRI